MAANLRLVRGGQSQITQEDFERAIIKGETKDRVQSSLSDLTRNLELRITSWPNVAVLPGYNPRADRPVHEVKEGAKRILGIITSVLFPQALIYGAGVEEQKALEIASDFVLGYGIVAQGLLLSKVVGKFAPATDNAVWSEDYRVEGAGQRGIPYRFAAVVALHGQHESHGATDQIRGLRFNGLDAPIHAHLAGLADPLSYSQAAIFHEVVRKGVQ